MSEHVTDENDWQPMETAPRNVYLIVRGGDGLEYVYRNGWVHVALGDALAMPKQWRWPATV